MPDQTDRFATVYKVLGNAIACTRFPGCAFGVLAGGEVVLADALGRFTYEDDSPLVEPHTVFDVASITKVVSTTAVAMLLYQRGLLDLDTPLGELLPGFVVGRESGRLARQVTIRHLLAHNSGLPGYVEFFRTVSHSRGTLSRLPGTAHRGRARRAQRVLRSRLHPARQGARGPDTRGPGDLGAKAGL